MVWYSALVADNWVSSSAGGLTLKTGEHFKIVITYTFSMLIEVVDERALFLMADVGV